MSINVMHAKPPTCMRVFPLATIIVRRLGDLIPLLGLECTPVLLNRR